MSTMELIGPWYAAELTLRRWALALVDWIVDAARCVKREHVRRSGRQTGAHRLTKDRNNTVWDLLHALPDEEFAKLDVLTPRAPGRHADKRGWRYNSPVWHVIERSADDREWNAHWSAEVNRLMDDLQDMLANPPQPETMHHGCSGCLCGAADRWVAIDRYAAAVMAG